MSWRISNLLNLLVLADAAQATARGHRGHSPVFVPNKEHNKLPGGAPVYITTAVGKVQETVIVWPAVTVTLDAPTTIANPLTTMGSQSTTFSVTVSTASTISTASTLLTPPSFSDTSQTTTSQSTTSQTTTFQTTTSSTLTTQDPFEAEAQYIGTALREHNIYRTNHSANPLSWNEEQVKSLADNYHHTRLVCALFSTTHPSYIKN